jgi:hypothetical protein
LLQPVQRALVNAKVSGGFRFIVVPFARIRKTPKPHALPFAGDDAVEFQRIEACAWIVTTSVS